jgi:adenosylcobinamide-GDP ribazoletransferase
MEWSEKNMRYSIAFLPAVGAVIGAAFYAFYALTVRFGAIFYAFGATAVPVIITGGVHMDGFCDTVDAISARRDREKTLEILKDPNAGAFAVIYSALYFLAQIALISELRDRASVVLISVGFIFSRACAAFATVTFKSARSEGFLAAYANSAAKKPIAAATVVLALAITLFNPIYLVIIAYLIFYNYFAQKKFGGITGDILGFFIQTSELLAALAVFINKNFP